MAGATLRGFENVRSIRDVIAGTLQLCIHRWWHWLSSFALPRHSLSQSLIRIFALRSQTVMTGETYPLLNGENLRRNSNRRETARDSSTENRPSTGRSPSIISHTSRERALSIFSLRSHERKHKISLGNRIQSILSQRSGSRSELTEDSSSFVGIPLHEWKWYNDVFALGPLLFVVSVAIGTTFYVYFNNWTVWTSIFVAVSTLLGNTYDIPSQELDGGSFFTILFYIYGISLFSGGIGVIVGNLVTAAPLITAEARRQLILMEQPEDTDGDGAIGCGDYSHYVITNMKYAVGWEDHWFKYAMAIAVLCWIGVGIFYGVFFEELSYRSAFYFALNAVSQASLRGPACIGEKTDCDIDALRAVLVSLYLVVGVPLFAFTVGQLARLMMERVIRSNERGIIHKPLTEDEYNYAANLYGTDEVISLGEFTILELLRLRRVSLEDLEQVKHLFCAIDELDTGIVDKTMLQRRNLYHGYQTAEPAAPIGLDDKIQWIHRKRSPSLSRVSEVNEVRDSPGDDESYQKCGSDKRIRFNSGDSFRGSDSDVPREIRRITLNEYNERVVPLAYTNMVDELTTAMELEDIEEGISL